MLDKVVIRGFRQRLGDPVPSNVSDVVLGRQLGHLRMEVAFICSSGGFC